MELSMVSPESPAVGDQFEFSADPTCITLEMPVLFHDDSGALAYTNNHVNSLIDGGTVFSAQTFGPNVNYGGSGASDILGDYVTNIFAIAGLSVTMADERYYHDSAGSIHCGTNVQRVIPSYNWWEK